MSRLELAGLLPKYSPIRLHRMDGLVSGQTRTYDDFKKLIPPQVEPLFNELRNYCLSLGKNVVEDVRMHRVVFCKSMTFRYFADIEVQRDSVLVNIRMNRKEPPQETEIKINDNLDRIRTLLSEAYSKIH